MIETCRKCGKDFLTEADPYVVYPKTSGVELYCTCQILFANTIEMTPEEKSHARDVLDGLLRDAYQRGYAQGLQGYIGLSKQNEKRQTGRTKRMLWAAKEAFAKGRNVFIVISDRNSIQKVKTQLGSLIDNTILPRNVVKWNHCRSGFFPEGNIKIEGSIRIITCENAGFDPDRLVLPGVPEEDVFIDHLVIRGLIKKNLFRHLDLLKRWDEK